MAASALSAGRTLCELRDWSVSNLELQKILYLAHMYYLGQHDGEPLIHEEFEAWNYGPVVPKLYHHVKWFGIGPVRNVFHCVDPVALNTPEFEVLSAAAACTKGMRAGQLVANTNWDGGAWASVYRPNIFGIKIHNFVILNEYRSRYANSTTRNSTGVIGMLGRNKMTTGGGLLALVGAVGSVFTSLSTGDMPDMQQISVILVGLGSVVTGLFARDHNVSDGS